MATSSQTPSTTQRVAELAPVAEALSALVAECAELPRPYIVLFTSRPAIGVQLSDPSEFELWREALGVQVSDVGLTVTPTAAWLAVSARYRGVELDVTGHGVSVSVEQAEAPRDVEAVAA